MSEFENEFLIGPKMAKISVHIMTKMHLIIEQSEVSEVINALFAWMIIISSNLEQIKKIFSFTLQSSIFYIIAISL